MVIEESIIYFVLGISLGVFVSSLIFVYLNKKRTLEIAQKVKEILEEKEKHLTDIKEEREELKEELKRLGSEYENVKIKSATLKEKLDIERDIKEKMKMEFENISREILEKENERFEKEGIKNITFLVKPLEEEIKNFYYKIEEESKERFSLTKEIEKLRELNNRLSEDASNLTDALKGNSQIQGAWGEMILEKILEESGLEEGREYEIQLSMKKKNDKTYRPDVIIRLPKNRTVIIDSKVSLKAYERYFNTKDENEKQKALNEHMNSVYIHLKELSQKKYQELELNTLDFVLMFIPIEGAFTAAIKEDNELFLRAQRQNIILVSPTTLLATLRTIENIWRHEYQNQNAKLIAKKAGDLYDKFVGFMQSMQNIGIQLDKAHNSYDEALKRLSNGKGSLVKRSLELKNMHGVFSQKEVSKNFLEQLEEKSSETAIFNETRKIKLERSES